MIYFCIPAYNEAATVGVLLWKIRRVMEDLPRDYEVLVLDDASTDTTLDVLAPYARVLPLTVIRQNEQQGYAAAIERLIREAVSRSTHPRRDIVITLQADFTEAPEDLPTLIRRMEGGADIVEGAVLGEGLDVPRLLRYTRKGIPLLLKGVAIPTGSLDPVSGFRAYRVTVLKRTLADLNGSPLLTSDGWAANVELLMAVGRHSRRTEGVEVSRRHRMRQRESRFQPWNTLVRVWKLGRRFRGRSTVVPSPEPV